MRRTLPSTSLRQARPPPSHLLLVLQPDAVSKVKLQRWRTRVSAPYGRLMESCQTGSLYLTLTPPRLHSSRPPTSAPAASRR
jgi:hypothetical protein